MSKRYCVFAAYNKENKIEKELVFYLEELNKIVDGIVFVMDNPLNDKEKKKLENLTIYNECKKHGEYDFGSYKRGFFYLKENGFLDEADELIFANDSCYGPLKPFNLFIEKWEKENKPDFYGVTINNYGHKYSTEPNLSKYSPHIQSYFFLITKNIFEKDFFIDFFKSVKHLDSYVEIIKAYEMGLSALITKNGYNMSAYFNSEDLKNNPTYEHKQMLKTIKHGFLIKKKNYYMVDKNKNLANFILSNSIFPYVMDKNGNFVKKGFFNPGIIYLIKHLLHTLLINIFNIENQGCAKIIKFFGIKLKIKRYGYKISSHGNSIIVKSNNCRTTPKEKKIDGLEIIINGEKNYIFLSPNYKFQNSKIEINASNCVVDIKSKHPISNLNIKVEKENSQSLIINENTKIVDLNINSTTQDVLIEVKDGEISNSTANIEAFTDEENRPRMIIKQGV